MVFPKIGLLPNHPFLIGFSTINHPFSGTTIFGNALLVFLARRRVQCSTGRKKRKSWQKMDYGNVCWCATGKCSVAQCSRNNSRSERVDENHQNRVQLAKDGWSSKIRVTVPSRARCWSHPIRCINIKNNILLPTIRVPSVPDPCHNYICRFCSMLHHAWFLHLLVQDAFCRMYRILPNLPECLFDRIGDVRES